MFTFPDAPGPIRDDLIETFRGVWTFIANPGTWWTGAESISIAETVRAARLGAPTPSVDLPVSAVEAAILLGGTPASATEAWVEKTVIDLGEEAYTELLGIAGMTVAIDTFTRLMGSPPEPFPAPVAGSPTRTTIEHRPPKGKTWITMGPIAVPPFILSLVPAAMQRGNAIENHMYMTGEGMADNDFRRGELHRTQIEFVSSSLSHANECFY